MASRVLETAGFITIAAALHVSAAALLLPQDAAQGLRPDAAPAPLSAGSPEIEAMIAKWEAPPEVRTQTATPLSQTQQPREPELALARPAAPDPSRIATAMPQPAPMAEARPNLPQPAAEPVPRIETEALPLQSFATPEIEVEPALTLKASDRPAVRPAPRPRPQTAAEQSASQPGSRRQAEPAPQRQAASAQVGEAGQAQTGQHATSSEGGSTSPQQLARIEASWRQQIGACMARSVSHVSGGRGAQLAVNFMVARDGRVQGASLAGSSGDRRVDQQVLRAVRRARCPAAPGNLPQGEFSFQQPFAIR